MQKVNNTIHRGFRWGAGPALILFIFLNACSAASIPAPEAIHPSGAALDQPSFDEKAPAPEDLSSELSFISFLKLHEATNIVSAKGYVNEKIVSAVTADHMKQIYIFGDGKYFGRLEIRCDSGRHPVRPFVKIIHGKNRFGVLLVADNLALNGKRISQLILVKKGGEKTYISLTMDLLEKNNGGMVDPYVGGEDLESGVIFCAKNSNGKAWKTIFIITASDETVKVEKMPRYFAHTCPCFMSWVKGKDARELFGMKL